MIFSHLNVHLYWPLYLSLLENVTSYGIDGHTFNAAEAIGVLTNVSPVIHMEVFGWDFKYCFSPHVDRKDWIEVKCQGWYFHLFTCLNPFWRL